MNFSNNKIIFNDKYLMNKIGSFLIQYYLLRAPLPIRYRKLINNKYNDYDEIVINNDVILKKKEQIFSWEDRTLEMRKIISENEDCKPKDIHIIQYSCANLLEDNIQHL